MGQTCGTRCNRDRRDSSQNDDCLENQYFYEFLNNTRSQATSYDRPKDLISTSKFDNILLSASNYWQNRQTQQYHGYHRPVVTYNINLANQLIKVKNFVFTKQEQRAIRKIERWWIKIRTYRNLNQNSSLSLRYRCKI